ncbi:hypothetical protein ACI4BE_30320, partial [Klebsiella pneumoniae]|uniref:hypothetical protein n=1 Tax=Klebsiella pneumoniae TaxID=573 RepID=UPI003854F16F
GKPVPALVSGDLKRPTKVTLLGEGDKPLETMELSSKWWPGDLIWSGTVHGREVAVQVRPVANGYDLAYRGIRARVH